MLYCDNKLSLLCHFLDRLQSIRTAKIPTKLAIFSISRYCKYSWESINLFEIKFFFFIRNIWQFISNSNSSDTKYFYDWSISNSSNTPISNDLLTVRTKKEFTVWATSWQNQQNGICPTKTQISQGIRRDWSESSLFAWSKIRSLATHCAHSEDWSDWADAQADLSLWDQTGRMPRLIWVFVGFVMRRLICTKRNEVKFRIEGCPETLLFQIRWLRLVRVCVVEILKIPRC